MIRNMSMGDKIFRWIIVAVIAALYFTGTVAGNLAIGLGIVGIILLLTTFVNFCPLYRIFSFSTHKE